jgi:hypothetical protein
MAVQLVDVLGSHLTKIVDAFNAERRQHIADLGAGFTVFHADKGEVAVTAANASDLATSLTLVNQLKSVYETHRQDTLCHKVADGTNVIAAPFATTLATAITLANEIKADYNTHRASTTFHYNADATNAVAAANASDQGTLNTLVNEIKGDLNAHMASGPATGYALRVVPL